MICSRENCTHKCRNWLLIQADVTALISALLGIPYPANSIGVLPLVYLSPDIDARQQVQLLKANAMQIYEQFLV